MGSRNYALSCDEGSEREAATSSHDCSPKLVSAPSGWITTITLQDGALNRLVNLYRGRGGRPKLEGASLNGWPVWRVGILLSGLICNRSARKGIVVTVIQICPIFDFCFIFEIQRFAMSHEQLSPTRRSFRTNYSRRPARKGKTTIHSLLGTRSPTPRPPCAPRVHHTTGGLILPRR